MTEKLWSGPHTIIGPADGAAEPRDIEVLVAGEDHGAGNGGSRAVAIGRDAWLDAHLAAPDGTLWLRTGSRATGRFVARDIEIGPSATVATAP